MTTMTRVQAEALATFVTRVRPEWRQAGILAALEKAAPTADVYDVARALLNLAAEPSVLTPGLLPGPGPHWRKPDGQRIPRRGDHNVPCPDHDGHTMPCTHRDHTGDMTPEQVAAAAAECRRIAAAKTDEARAKRAEIETRRQEATR